MAYFRFTRLTSTAFLGRSADVYAERDAVVDGDLRLTYAELYRRCRWVTGVLAGLGVEPGDRVAVLATNSHVLLAMKTSSLMRGGILVPLNQAVDRGARLHARAVQLDAASAHRGARRYRRASRREGRHPGPPFRPNSNYERRLVDAEPADVPCTDERGLLGNYTSGTTGQPKGVMIHHRGAYLQGLSLFVHGRMGEDTAYLWTVPMFECNGWCITCGVTPVGSLHDCLRQIDPERILPLLRDEGVSHLSTALTVLTRSRPPRVRPDRPSSAASPSTPVTGRRPRPCSARWNDWAST